LSDKPNVPHTLLLADDSVTIQRVIELTFADEDVNVVAVSDGDQAILRIEAAPPDIVLADIGMPGKNGYEVAQHIRQSPRLAHIPVVLLTGAFEPVDQARADAAGCDGVLAKPFEPQLVIGRVKELLAKTRGKGEARVATTAATPAAAPRSEPAKGGWTPAPPEPSREPAGAPIELHDYFDRLDAAFANLTPSTPPAPASGSTSAAPSSDLMDWFGDHADAAAAGGTWEFDKQEAAPTTYASPPPLAPVFPIFDPPDRAAPAPSAEPLVPHSFGGDAPPVAPPAPADLPPAPVMAETQATLASMPPSTAGIATTLQQTAPRPAAPLPSAASPAARKADLPPLADAFAALLAAEQDPAAPAAPLWPVATAPAVVSDGLVEEVARRVLERLSDTIVRETVGEIVTKVAEQLVRQEIERIKAQLR
jgi:CheY-like chemotaxis protein